MVEKKPKQARKVEGERVQEAAGFAAEEKSAEATPSGPERLGGDVAASDDLLTTGLRPEAVEVAAELEHAGDVVEALGEIQDVIDTGRDDLGDLEDIGGRGDIGGIGDLGDAGGLLGDLGGRGTATDPSSLAADAGLGGVERPDKGDADLSGAGGADPRIASGTWSGSQEWTDTSDGSGGQSVSGSEAYEDGDHSMTVETSHKDGITTQTVTMTNKATGVTTKETTTTNEKTGETTETSTSGGESESDDSSGGEPSGEDTSGGETPEKEDGGATDPESTPDPMGEDPTAEPFADGEFLQVGGQALEPLGPGSLMQPAGEGSIDDDRPIAPEQLDRDAMGSGLDPLIQTTGDEVEFEGAGAPRIGEVDAGGGLIDPGGDEFGTGQADWGRLPDLEPDSGTLGGEPVWEGDRPPDDGEEDLEP
jgi:hypothetical protein